MTHAIQYSFSPEGRFPTALCVPRNAKHQEGESPSLARCCLSVIESNCVTVRWGGKQLKMNNQSATYIIANPIRPDDVTSLRGNGEVPQIRLLAVKERFLVGQSTHANTGTALLLLSNLAEGDFAKLKDAVEELLN